MIMWIGTEIWSGSHLKPLETEKIGDNSIFLMVQTLQSRIIMAQAARTTLFKNNKILQPVIETYQSEGYIGQVLRTEVSEGETYTLEKVVGIYTSRDRAISEPAVEAKEGHQTCWLF